MATLNGTDEPLRELALFAGAGGGILGGKLLGWRTVCAVEYEAYPASVLVARQNDGCLEPFPIWDDVRTFDGKPWRGRVDVVSGGFPCQDISAAGKGAGIDGERSGLWREMARIIGEVRPRYVLVENSPMLVIRGIGRVLGDLAALGYDARWGIVSAADAGAIHLRERIWIVADSMQNRQFPCELENDGSQGERRTTTKRGKNWIQSEMVPPCRDEMEQGRLLRPDSLRADDDMANWLDRLAAVGNGQFPHAVRLAWETLKP